MHLGESVSVFMVMVDLQAAEGVGGILYAGNSLDLVKKKKKSRGVQRQFSSLTDHSTQF